MCAGAMKPATKGNETMTNLEIWTKKQGAMIYTTETGLMVKKNDGGWGNTYNYKSSRKWAAFVNGKDITTKSGAIRTFASSDAAKAAAEKSAEFEMLRA